VIVTGATSGLGVGFAHAVAAVGGSVVLVGHRAARLELVSKEPAEGGATVRAKPTDVAYPAAWQRATWRASTQPSARVP
jgi:NADP-dependent 3-hydroxy acid dehydrogenase YdfG